MKYSKSGTTITNNMTLFEVLLLLKKHNVGSLILVRDKEMYNAVSNVVYRYILRHVLTIQANRTLIASTNMKAADEFSTIVTQHVLTVLDSILACEPEDMMAYFTTVCSNKCSEIARNWRRAVQPAMKTNDGYVSRRVYMEDAAMACIAAPHTVEDEAVAAENAAEAHAAVMELLPHMASCTLFELVSLVGLRVLGMKPRELAALLHSDGLAPTAQMVLGVLLESMQLPADTAIACKHSDMPPYQDVSDLAKLISKACDRCKDKLYKKHTKHHNK